jgi:hypothetical protein
MHHSALAAAMHHRHVFAARAHAAGLRLLSGLVCHRIIGLGAHATAHHSATATWGGRLRLLAATAHLSGRWRHAEGTEQRQDTD